MVSKTLNIKYDKIKLSNMANQYSFIVIASVVVILVIIFGWKLIGLRFAIPIAIIVSVLMLIFMLSFSTKNQHQMSINDFENSLLTDRPVFLVMYSNY